MIEGKVINLRLVEEKDASFILKLRNKDELKKFISPTKIRLEEQIKWIKAYKTREKEEKEFYFIVENKQKESCGTARIYNINKSQNNCTFGSLILDFNRPDKSSYDVIKTSFKFIKENLKIENIYSKTNKKNQKVIYVVSKLEFEKIDEDEEEIFYIVRM